MSTISNLVVSPLAATSQLVDPKTGLLTPYGQTVLQRIIQAINAALNILGQFNGVIGPDATVAGHVGTLQGTVSRLTATGQLASLLDIATGRNLDNIADTATYQRTTATDVAGAQTAYAALVGSSPTANLALLFDGVAWTPNSVPYSSVSGAPAAPNNLPPAANQFVTGFVAPNFFAGPIDFSNLTGNLATSQLPAAGITHVIPLGPLTVGGTTGSITVTNGLITGSVDPT